LIPDQDGGLAGILLLVQHQLPRFLQAQLLLVLQRAHSSDVVESLPEGGRAHIRVGRQVVHANRLGEILLDPGHDTGDLLARRVFPYELPKLRAVRACQEADDDFLLDEGSEAGEEDWIVEQVDQTAQGIEQGWIERLNRHGFMSAIRVRSRQFHFRRRKCDRARVEPEQEPEIGFQRSGAGDV